jgi:photosystem II stability/assembly factor-like uncharacterized protein
MVLKTDNGGSSWHQVYFTQKALYGVYFITPDIGWVVGAGGAILSTANGGASWQLIPSNTDEDLLVVSVSLSGEIFIAGTKSTLLKSTNNKGQTFIKVPVQGNTDLVAITQLSPNLLMALGRDQLFVSKDSGASWAGYGPYKWKTLASMVAIDPLYALIAAGVLLRTNDGGNSLEFLPVSQEGRISRIRSIGNVIFVIATSAESGSAIRISGRKLPSESFILRSTDMGEHWKTVFHLKNAKTHTAYLEDIFFVDNSGWAVGADGTVVHSIDSGQTWKMSPVDEFYKK